MQKENKVLLSLIIICFYYLKEVTNLTNFVPIAHFSKTREKRIMYFFTKTIIMLTIICLVLFLYGFSKCDSFKAPKHEQNYLKTIGPNL